MEKTHPGLIDSFKLAELADSLFESARINAVNDIQTALIPKMRTLLPYPNEGDQQLKERGLRVASSTVSEVIGMSNALIRTIPIEAGTRLSSLIGNARYFCRFTAGNREKLFSVALVFEPSAPDIQAIDASFNVDSTKLFSSVTAYVG